MVYIKYSQVHLQMYLDPLRLVTLFIRDPFAGSLYRLPIIDPPAELVPGVFIEIRGKW